MALTTTPTNALGHSLLSTLTLPGAEISAFDAASKRLFVTSDAGLSIVDFADPSAPVLITTVDFTAEFGSTNVSSVAVKNGVVAAAIIATDKTQPGTVVFLDAATGTVTGAAIVGANPDHVGFTPDGTKVLVANEGELDASGVDPEGSVSIIDIAGGVGSPVVLTAGFGAFNGQEDALRAEGVRIFAGKTVAQDLEPEYIAVSHDGTKAMVTLQEANAVAILDIATATFTDIVPLGTKDFSGLLADFSDRDGAGGSAAMNLTTGNPVHGLFMPDSIASFTAGGQTYYVIANEGDDRDDFLSPGETIRVGNNGYDLDDATFPNEAALKANGALGRLTVSNAPGLRGDTDGDGDIDQILTYGARSFSILDASGQMVFDSADIIERVVAEQFLALFDDSRSDNKGPEPEGISVSVIGDKTYAFVGLERSNGVMIFDVTDPANVSYTNFITNAGDVAPEGLLNISAADSPTGKPLLVVSNEGSTTVTAYELTPAVFTLQLLHFSDAEAGLLAGASSALASRGTAANLAALVDAFDDQYANTLILAGGDNFLPGPFMGAGTDPSVAATHSRGNNPGAADIEIHNRIGVEASTVGNHEFDLGTNAFSDAVLDAAFPYLSANLDFSRDGGISGRYLETVGVGGLEDASALAGRIVPSAVVDKGGEKIGLVGVTTQIVEGISSTGNVEVKGFEGDGAETNDMVLLAAQLQPVIDDLIAQGVNKIVLMSHLQQIAFEKALAPLLSGVDIILSAGSNTRLGDDDDQAVAFPGHAADFADTYPIVTAGADGKTTVIVNTDNEFTYLGRLVIDFDANGEIILDSLTGRTATNGAYASTDANVAEAWNTTVDNLGSTAFADGTKGAGVAQITGAVQNVIETKDGTIYGYTNVYLEGERNLVRNQETNLGSLTADANAQTYRSATGLGDDTVVVSFKNGGGIRAQIGAVDPVTGAKNPPIANEGAEKPAGAISQLDVENSLRFDNKLMVFDTTAAGLKAILEHGVASLGNQGRFPQIAGVRFSYDPDLAAGSRIVSMALVNGDGEIVARLVENGAVLTDVPATISVVTLNFLANGGDGYPTKANADNFRYLLNDGTLGPAMDEAFDFTASANVPATALGEQQALREYLQLKHATPEAAYDVADTAPVNDTRIQDLNARGDGVFDGATIGDDSIVGTDGDDHLFGGAGNDALSGGLGSDVIDGGTGFDTYVANAGATAGISVDLVNGYAADGNGSFDRLISIEGVKGTDFADFIIGNEGAQIIEGLGGDDVIYGFGGADVLDGGAGNDIVIAGDGPGAHLKGGAGNDQLWSGNGNDYAEGGEGDDLIVTGAGSDFVFGGAGNDVIYGGSGSDYIFGGAGNDFIWTDDVGQPASRDYIYIGSGTGIDTVADFTVAGEASDVVVISGVAGISSFADIQARLVQADVYAVVNLSPEDQLYLYNVTASQLTANNFIFA